MPLVLRSHEIWREIKAGTGESLLHQCGAMVLVPAGNTAVVHGKAGFVRSTIAAVERYSIPHKVLDANEAMRRFLQFRLRGDEVVCYEPGGGYVRPEACVGAQLALAPRHGAGVSVATVGESFRAAGAVLVA